MRRMQQMLHLINTSCWSVESTARPNQTSVVSYPISFSTTESIQFRRVTINFKRFLAVRLPVLLATIKRHSHYKHCADRLLDQSMASCDVPIDCTCDARTTCEDRVSRYITIKGNGHPPGHYTPHPTLYDETRHLSTDLLRLKSHDS